MASSAATRTVTVHNHQIARLATMGQDQALAKSAFDEIGDHFLESVWRKPERLVHFRTWARTGQW